MTKLSIIIVNYNVKYFLEQAILSAQKSIAYTQKIEPSWDIEIYVVDNDSKDGSGELVAKKFPEHHLIANEKNLGFSKANNQAIRISDGEYVLLLNPDTVLEEDTLYKSILFMETHADAGGLGVKMIDGTGRFLPESKRGLPTPWVAFCKLTGLSALFPKSALFNRYHLGHLSPDETNEVQILSGAYMFMRRATLDQCGLLDEDFFMYGEDVDLSYRILLAGYKNYYLADTRIIHYKGESTKKGSLNYVRMFYNAMALFAQKHFGTNKAYIYFIKLGIYVRALITLLVGIIAKALPILIDASLLLLGMIAVKYFWENNIKAAENLHYPSSYLYFNIPLYTAIWIASLWVSGVYDRHKNLLRIVRGILTGSLIIAAIYGFLDENYRSSRAHILAGSALAIIVLPLWRLLWSYVNKSDSPIASDGIKKIAIVGEMDEVMRVRNLLNQSIQQYSYVGYFSNAINSEDHFCLGKIEDINLILPHTEVNEIIYCAKNISSKDIFNSMTTLGNDYDYKIVPPTSTNIIGSNNKNTAGDLYTLEVNMQLQDPFYKRQKKILDLIVAFLLIPLLPYYLLTGKISFIMNWARVLMNRMTWVGYADHTNQSLHLPPLKPCVWSIDKRFQHTNTSTVLSQINFQYAKDYTPYLDLEVIWKNWYKG